MLRETAHMNDVSQTGGLESHVWFLGRSDATLTSSVADLRKTVELVSAALMKYLLLVTGYFK